MTTPNDRDPSLGVSEATVRSHIAAQNRALHARDMAEAMTHAVMAVEGARQLGEPALLADALMARATVHDAAGNCDQALQDLEVVRAAFDAAGLQPTLRFYNVLSGVYNTQRRWDESVDACREAVQAARRVGDDAGQALALIVLAAFLSDVVEIAQEQGREAPQAPEQLAEARRACDTALALIQVSGAQHLRPSHNSTLGGVLLLQGHHEAAATVLQAQAEIARECGEATSVTWAHRLLARLALGQGDTAGALQQAQAGLANAQRLGQRRDEAKLQALLSVIHEARGELGPALHCLKQSIRVEREMATAAASVRTDVLGVQLRTEAARREAAAQRERAEALQRQAELLSREALEDALTGLANRRGVDAHLSRQHPLAFTGAELACVALLDVDHFKRVNDKFSHAVGDRVLQALGGLLRRHTRMKDLAGRYGGEEFVMCWAGVGLEDAVRLAERLRVAVQAHDWASLAPGLRVTVSLGLVDLGAYDSAPAALAAADMRLYAAKARGRNQVSCDTD